MNGIPLTDLTLAHFCACPKPRSGFPMPYAMLDVEQVYTKAKVKCGSCNAHIYHKDSERFLLNISKIYIIVAETVEKCRFGFL
jgi:hypothetical protein